jgi:hypothetical protein
VVQQDVKGIGGHVQGVAVAYAVDDGAGDDGKNGKIDPLKTV